MRYLNLAIVLIWCAAPVVAEEVQAPPADIQARENAHEAWIRLKKSVGESNLTRLEWLAQHPKMAERLLQHHRFLAAHPDVIKKLMAHEGLLKTPGNRSSHRRSRELDLRTPESGQGRS